MPAATCHPGQKSGATANEPTSTVATAGAPVLLKPVTGSFGSGGTVRLVTDGGSCNMTVQEWNSDKVIAYIPSQNPNSDDDDQKFTIRITVTGGETFEAKDVSIIGPSGGYPDPPMHFLAQFNLMKIPEGAAPAPPSGEERPRRGRRTRV